MALNAMQECPDCGRTFFLDDGADVQPGCLCPADDCPSTETPDGYEVAKVVLDAAILAFAKEANLLGVYMPSLATYLRIHADELAEAYPDDANGGFHL